MNQDCPLCQKSRRAKKFRPLYGKDVCKQCYYAFANRRQIAFVVDMLLIQFVVYGISIMLAVGVAITLAPTQQEGDFYGEVIVWGMLALTYGMLLLKDGLAGQSPGKFLCGVQALHEDTRAPGSFLQSIQRNLPTLIPFVPLIIALQLARGKRWGDGWAKTRVIWKKYGDHPVFTGAPLTAADQVGEGYMPSHELPPADSSNPFEPPPR